MNAGEVRALLAKHELLARKDLGWSSASARWAFAKEKCRDWSVFLRGRVDRAFAPGPAGK